MRAPRIGLQVEQCDVPCVLDVHPGEPALEHFTPGVDAVAVDVGHGAVVSDKIIEHSTIHDRILSQSRFPHPHPSPGGRRAHLKRSREIESEGKTCLELRKDQ